MRSSSLLLLLSLVLLPCALLGGASGSRHTAADRVNSSTGTAKRTVKKQLRWYLGNPAEVQEFMTGENTEHYLNFTEDVSDITGGVYQCCNGQDILANGSLSGYNASRAPWNLTAFSQLDMFHILSLTGNCSATGEPAGCWSVGQTCNAALARVDDFASELLAFLEAYDLKGPVLDWEYGYGCNVTCHEELWSQVSKTLRANGKELAISVDDSKGVPINDPTLGNWSYETDWGTFLPYTDVLINMGTYPGSWAKGISWPAWEYLKSYPCPAYLNSSRTCGVEGQIYDMIENGADPAYQLQPGIWIDECFPNGTMTQQGWTEDALSSFLQVLDEKGVHVLTVWTGDAFLLPSSRVTCPWFMPTLRKWALG